MLQRLKFLAIFTVGLLYAAEPALASPEARSLLNQGLQDPAVQGLLQRGLNDPETMKLAGEALNSDAAQALLGQVLGGLAKPAEGRAPEA